MKLMNGVAELACQLEAFWKEVGMTYQDYCRGRSPVGRASRGAAEWEEYLETYPDRETFYRACVQYCATGLENELRVLKEAISIDIESNYFVEVLWNMKCRHDEILPSLMGDVSRNVRMQTVWLLRDIGEPWALAKLREMRADETDTLVMDQLNGVIAFMEDRDSLDLV